MLLTQLSPFRCISCNSLTLKPFCRFCDDHWVSLSQPIDSRIATVELFALWIGNPIAYQAFSHWKRSGSARIQKQLCRVDETLLQNLRNLEPDVIVPIPQDPRRSWVRGFESAQETAQIFAEVLELPVAQALELSPQAKALAADRHQSTRSRLERILSPNPFQFKEGAEVEGTVLLVDDIVTTGATLNFAKAILESRVERVVAATLLFKPKTL